MVCTLDPMVAVVVYANRPGVISHYLLDDRTEHILLAAPHQVIPPILAPLDGKFEAWSSVSLSPWT